jgi:Polyketide synthase modules and related proteins
METVKDYILKQVAAKSLSREEAVKLLQELKPKTDKSDGGVAIIGLACNFPGGNSAKRFWDNMVNGTDCISDLPEGRKKDNLELLSNPIYRKLFLNADLSEKDINQGDIGFVKAGYLDEIDKFDADFFGIPPAEARFIDPIQRVFLETAWKAIEDAGYGGKKIYGTNTSVFVGRDNTGGSVYKIFTQQDQMHLTGSWTGILASRLSYLFNLKGAAEVIDTACSSGAVAIHEACKAIRNRECDFAVAGGIQINTQLAVKGQQTTMEMVESADSKVRTFDRKADGTVWGEGVGVLLLKSLSKAIDDRDHIYAVIKGSAVNNDGASNGITAPNAQAQEEVIVQAWRNAKVNPETISYIEAHGTGTVLGDPIEIKGLSNAFGRFTNKKQFCGIGSVKTNIGHLVGASGLASVIKVVLSLKNGVLPGSINFSEPNTYINFEDTPFYVNDRLQKWEKEAFPKRAGVSSFGFSGTNCHIVLEEAPCINESDKGESTEINIFTISAKSENALKNYVHRYAEYMEREISCNLRDMCYTSQVGRGHYEWRIALLIRDIEDLKGKISCIYKNGFEGAKVPWLYFGRHHVIAGGKTKRDVHDINEEQKNTLSIKADRLIHAMLQKEVKDKNTTMDLCSLYVSGAEVDWDRLYSGQLCKKVSLPGYPLERVRFWAPHRYMSLEGLEQKDFALQGQREEHEGKSGLEVCIKGRTSGEKYSDTEKLLAAIFAGALEIQEIDIEEDFFEMGGNSLIFIKIQALAEKNNIKIDQSDINTYSTVKELSLYVDNKMKTNEEDKNVNRV